MNVSTLCRVSQHALVEARRMRVLIVEDEYVILDDLEFFARAAGCTVIGSVPSAGEARSIYRSELPDVALLDVQLRDGPKGLELAAELAEAGVMNWLITGDTRFCQTHSRHALGCVLKPTGVKAFSQRSRSARR